MSGRLFASAAEAASWAAGLAEWVPGRRHFEYVTSTGSTQDMAFAAAAGGAPHGSLFLAEEQTAGRGRRGSRWEGTAGKSLTFSVLLRDAGGPSGTGTIPIFAALSVCRAVEDLCAAGPEVKWPNDLVLAGRKFGGLLTEVRGGAAVLGVGINVLQNASDFPEGLSERAVSLAAACGRPPDRLALLGGIVGQLGSVFGPDREPRDRLLSEVSGRLAWRGQRVRVGALRGVLTGITEEGYLVLEGPGGERRTVASGSPELDRP